MGCDVLVVDDDPDLRDALDRYLMQEGFTVIQAADGAAIDTHMLMAVSLVLCDINLPNESGFDIARRIRTVRPDVGLIMLTGRGDLMDKVLGLELGADDYVQKPFELRELLARIRSVLRRRAGGGTSPSAAPGLAPTTPLNETIITFGGWKIDRGARTVRAARGEALDLTTTEFSILNVLAESRPESVTREMLYQKVKGREWSPLDRSIDTHVANLRRKVSHLGYPEIIKTVHGKGYVLAVSDRDTPES